MTKPTFIRKLNQLWRDARGVTAVTVALSMVVIIGITGLAIDIGHVELVQRQLQTSTDAAALAGAYNINTTAGSAITVAKSYSSTAGNKNVISGVTTTMASGYPVLKCLTSISLSCVGSDSANAIQVSEQSVVPMYFAQIFGVPSITVSATSTASAKGGIDGAMNVMVILDTTASMASGTDSGCGLGANSSREDCAKAGVKTLLQRLNPAVDYVGLMVFPGIEGSSQAAKDTTCGQTLPTGDIQTYSNSPVYQIVGLSGSNTYLSGSPPALNPSSPIVLATGAGGCSSGVTAPGGEGTYYAGAINAAQAALTSFAAPHTQNVIVLLSDGDAYSSDVQISFKGRIGGTCTTKNSKTTCAASTTLSVSTCSGCAASSTSSQQGPLAVGDVITGTGIPAGTTITAMSSGTTGGVGTYTVSNSLSVGTTSSAVSMTGAASVTYNGTTFAQNADQCAQAVAAAKAAAAAGTWVYSLAYGADTSSGSSCSTDSPAISSCTAMQDIANSPSAMPDASKFYSNANAGQDCPGAITDENLIDLFNQLANSFSQPRLIPNNTT
ncbi:MAG TPA: pilus assembly protein TadG-related protein [Caulobacteraceae bacterium]|jgi:Flp pilus assembly protein TadG|nr:pilus assembly protein TadG-related protein [Caulobacteraceae bacterium]